MNNYMPLLSFLMALCLMTQAPAEQNAQANADQLKVVISGLQDMTGQLLVSIFKTRQGFPSTYKKAFRNRIVPITNTHMSIVFDDLNPGIYAVSVCHDQNNSGDMDSKIFGRPKEGYGLSNDPQPGMGPPRFEDAAFELSPPGIEIAINMRYPE